MEKTEHPHDGTGAIQRHDLLSVPTTGRAMPYADKVKRREAAKRLYEAKGSAAMQRERLYRRLRQHFLDNEKLREKGEAIVALVPKPKARTLEEYGIDVTLTNMSMFGDETETNKNRFFVSALPRLREDWTPPADEEEALPDSTKGIEDYEREHEDFERRVRNNLETGGFTQKDSTVKVYLSRLRKLFRDTAKKEGSGILAHINSGRMLKHLMEQKVLNTRKQNLSAVLWLITNELLPGNVLDKAEDALVKAYKQTDFEGRVAWSKEKLDPRKEREHYSDLVKEVMTRIDDPYSEELTLLAVYGELTLRNDFKDMYVCYEDKWLWDDTDNYYLVKDGTFHFNTLSKVNNKRRKAFEWKASPELKAHLEEYLRRREGEDLMTQSLLFPTPPVETLKKMGLSINTLRHAKVNEMYDTKDMTPAQIEDLAETMNHAPLTNVIYQRGRSGKFAIA